MVKMLEELKKRQKEKPKINAVSVVTCLCICGHQWRQHAFFKFDLCGEILNIHVGRDRMCIVLNTCIHVWLASFCFQRRRFDNSYRIPSDQVQDVGVEFILATGAIG